MRGRSKCYVGKVTMYRIPDGTLLEYVMRHNDGPISWPVCIWDGASGQLIARTLDGKRWFVAEYSGWDGPRKWSAIRTPDAQPALRGA